MDELIFIGILILFSVLDAVAKSRKKKQERARRMGSDGLPVPEPTTYDPDEWEDDLPTYDDDLSYDDRLPAEVRHTPGRTSSESMVPREIWEEIAAITGVELPPEPKPEPARLPVPSKTRLPASRPAFEVEPRPDHRVHLAHAEYGTDPSERSASKEDGLDPLARTLGADASRARTFLVGRDRHALRQAIILQEVLGPPASLRE